LGRLTACLLCRASLQRTGTLHVADRVLTNDSFALEVGIRFYQWIEANKTLRVPLFTLSYHTGV
jgi:hypothetical protein